jgi:flagellar biosynthesis anti-sigma factor FlgM
MEIPREFRPTDPPARKRQAEAPARPPRAEPGPAPAADRAEVSAEIDPQSVQRLVQILKSMNPVDLHRVEDLRARIANGSYSADPDELAELLLGSGPRRA